MGANMKRVFLLTACFLILLPGAAMAQDFSLYGVSMGMPRAEISKLWKELENNQYYIEDSIFLNIIPEFDHNDQLYGLSFSVPIPLLDEHPGPFVTSAFQELIQEMWTSEDLVVSLRTGRGTTDVKVTNKRLQEKYKQHIRVQMQVQMGLIFKP
jgi:hypothetical protein